ncbi:hypothetical protein H8356DRAFT_1322794 [Neocallimastix lanati (nom. inval.)]|nr:hypothetical protein H8356DRAFT_1322794 [Neocallimastix sp. JGI-2020a]
MERLSRDPGDCGCKTQFSNYTWSNCKAIRALVINHCVSTRCTAGEKSCYGQAPHCEWQLFQNARHFTFMLTNGSTDQPTALKLTKAGPFSCSSSGTNMIVVVIVVVVTDNNNDSDCSSSSGTNSNNNNYNYYYSNTDDEIVINI